MIRPQQTGLLAEIAKAMDDGSITILEVRSVASVAISMLVSAFVGGFAGMVVRSLAREALGPEKKKMVSPVINLALPSAALPREELRRIADKYGWWATRQAEAQCPYKDTACVEREAKRLYEVVKYRRENRLWR
jgi:hypothetical protein